MTPLDTSRTGCPQMVDGHHQIDWVTEPGRTWLGQPHRNQLAHRRGECLACQQTFLVELDPAVVTAATDPAGLVGRTFVITRTVRGYRHRGTGHIIAASHSPSVDQINLTVMYDGKLTAMDLVYGDAELVEVEGT